MEPIAALTLTFALLVVATRAPLMVAPKATLDAFRAFLAKPARVRLLGAGGAALGARLAITAPPAADLHPTASGGLTLLGWYLIAASAWLVVFPRSYQAVAEGFLSIVSDAAVLRVFGTAAVGEYGELASGLRTVSRTAVAWFPTLLVLAVAIVLRIDHPGTEEALSWNPTKSPLSWPGELGGLFALLVEAYIENPLRAGGAAWILPAASGVQLLAAIWSLACPERGPADRVAGTWLVPR